LVVCFGDNLERYIKIIFGGGLRPPPSPKIIGGGLSWALLGLSWALLGSPVLSWALLGSPGLPWALLGSPALSWGSPVLSWGSPGLSWGSSKGSPGARTPHRGYQGNPKFLLRREPPGGNRLPPGNPGISSSGPKDKIGGGFGHACADSGLKSWV
jgi:hypothetical protein